jgi:hypothetical protein
VPKVPASPFACESFQFDRRKNLPMSHHVLSGAEFKEQLRGGAPKLGLFINSHSPTVAEQLAHSGYDWLLVDTQHGPMGYEQLSAMICGISSGGAKSMVRVAGFGDRGGIQQALDLGADGVLVPYINSADEGRQAAFGLLPAAQHEQSRAARLCRQRQRECDRGLAGGDRFLH